MARSCRAGPRPGPSPAPLGELGPQLGVELDDLEDRLRQGVSLVEKGASDLGLVGPEFGLGPDVALEDFAGQGLFDGPLDRLASAEVERRLVELGRDLVVAPDEGQLLGEFPHQEPADALPVRASASAASERGGWNEISGRISAELRRKWEMGIMSPISRAG